MPYEPKLRCLQPLSTNSAEADGVSLLSEKPVRPVMFGEDLLGLPLSRFAHEGRPIETRVPWWPETIWFVPGLADIEALISGGIARGRIWTAAELQQVADLDQLTDADLQNVARIKAMFGCSVLEAGPDAPPSPQQCTDSPIAASSPPRLPFSGGRP